jgi:circadian clock protein KaiB
MVNKSEPNTKSGGYVFRLFVAGDEPNSRSAKDNLRKVCDAHIKGPHEIEIVDVLKDFDLALEHNIFLTPALIILSSAQPVIVFGDLSDTQELIKFLGLEENV